MPSEVDVTTTEAQEMRFANIRDEAIGWCLCGGIKRKFYAVPDYTMA